MENIVGTAVWVIRYSDYAMSDEESIFSTKEKALAHLNSEFERLKDIWKNRTLIDKDELVEEPEWYIWSFDYRYSPEEKVEVQLYRTEIQ